MEKLKNRTRNILIIGVLVIILAIAVFYLYGDFDFKKTGKNIKIVEPEDQNFYFEEKCRCLEKNRIKCPENKNYNFEYDEERDFCVDGNDITTYILTCSKYECSGEVYNFDSENKEWSKE